MLSMRTSKVLFILACMSATAFARPASDATECNVLSTFTAKWEQPTATPTSGFGGADWSGWSVYESNSSAIRAKSGSHVIAANAIGAMISSHQGIYPYLGIQSFSFGCATIQQQYDGQYLPTQCDLLVITETDIRQGGIASTGPFTFTPDYSILLQGKPVPMAKAVLNATAQYFYFAVVQGAAPTQLYLDDIIMVAANPKCPSN